MTSPFCFVVDAAVFRKHVSSEGRCLASFLAGSVQGGRHLLGRLGPQDDHPGREGDAWAHVCIRESHCHRHFVVIVYHHHQVCFLLDLHWQDLAQVPEAEVRTFQAVEGSQDCWLSAHDCPGQ